MAAQDIDDVLQFAADVRQEYPQTAKQIEALCATVVSFDKQRDAMREVITQLLSIDDWHDEELAPAELIQKAREVLTNCQRDEGG
jgi:hypothetical protein